MLKEFKFHHIGIATKNIQITANIYINAGYNQSQIYNDRIQNVSVSFLTKTNNPMIELVEPINLDSPINSILSNNGTIPYHLCYEVNDIFESIINLKALKYIAISKPVTAVAFENRKICFLYNKDIGLIELLEK